MADEYVGVDCSSGTTTKRAFTAEEKADQDALSSRSTTEATTRDQANTNNQTLRQQASSALAGNRTFLAITSPTTAQNAAQIKALTRQMNGVIRLVLGALDGTD